MLHRLEAKFGKKRIAVYAFIIVFLVSFTTGWLIKAIWTSSERPVERLSLSWNTNPDPVNGYQVFKGMIPDANQMRKVLEMQAQNGSRQEVSWTVEELDVAQGQQVCFRVKAFNSEGTSDFSEAICTTL